MEKEIKRLVSIFTSMVNNANKESVLWMNVEPAKEAFEIMKQLPDIVEGEFDTPAQKSALLGQMLKQMNETLTPRFCIEVREYMASLDNNATNLQNLRMLRDYIDLSMPLEEFCKKYNRILKFDPIERTSEWENVIVDVERICHEKLKDAPKGMGFCFMYWYVREEELAKVGISWHSPSYMNPGVMFD